eukprot:g81689.t1
MKSCLTTVTVTPGSPSFSLNCSEPSEPPLDRPVLQITKHTCENLTVQSQDRWNFFFFHANTAKFNKTLSLVGTDHAACRLDGQSNFRQNLKKSFIRQLEVLTTFTAPFTVTPPRQGHRVPESLPAAKVEFESGLCQWHATSILLLYVVYSKLECPPRDEWHVFSSDRESCQAAENFQWTVQAPGSRRHKLNAAAEASAARLAMVIRQTRFSCLAQTHRLHGGFQLVHDLRPRPVPRGLRW